ncbi:MAG: dihydroorotate dehydrogenase-like protein, partial [Usitatibacteraceae bacterium]
MTMLRKVREAVKVPVIASLNGETPSGWLEYARLMQEAGADALELNVYRLATDPQETGAAGER